MSDKSERDKKIFQSYLENIKAKTGKTPADFRALAKEKGLTKAGEIVAWLKQESARRGIPMYEVVEELIARGGPRPWQGRMKPSISQVKTKVP